VGQPEKTFLERRSILGHDGICSKAAPVTKPFALDVGVGVDELNQFFVRAERNGPEHHAPRGSSVETLGS
jgi:hypothetical protein